MRSIGKIVSTVIYLCGCLYFTIFALYHSITWIENFLWGCSRQLCNACFEVNDTSLFSFFAVSMFSLLACILFSISFKDLHRRRLRYVWALPCTILLLFITMGMVHLQTGKVIYCLLALLLVAEGIFSARLCFASKRIVGKKTD